MFLSLFNNLTEAQKNSAVEELISESTPRKDFFLMMILSVLMATCGLLINSAAVIIGSMLIAPLLSPILSLSLGIVMSDHKLITRSFYTILKSTAFSLLAATILAMFFLPQGYGVTDEILARTSSSIIYVIIAIIAGTAASFAYVKPQLNKTLPGIAIAVALIPPLSVSGIGIAMFDWSIISKSFSLFMINIVGVILASTVVFSLMNLYAKRNLAEAVVKKEDRKMKKEEKLGEEK